ncbi:hypothetical protein P4B35_23165 [Pontiellaceae bacterium B12227]|nr:hypothetical protein [Pontiellaceae bacterium B12227]
MNRKRIIVISAALILGFVLILSVKKQSQIRAIEQVFRYDVRCTAEYKPDLLDSLGESLGIPSDDARLLALSLRAAPLKGCPSDFKNAYKAHIDAWNDYDSERIKQSWYQVCKIAERYGVDKRFYEN